MYCLKRVNKVKPMAALYCVLLVACAPMKDDISTVKPIQQQQIVLPKEVKLTSQQWPNSTWWKNYNDPQLNALIDRALKQSPSIALAHARVAKSRSDVTLIESGTQLKVNAMAEINAAHVSSNGYLGPFAKDRPVLGTTGPWYTEGIVGLGATLDIDLWGEHRDRLDAVIGVENAHRLEQKAVELEISADVAQLYYGIQTTDQVTLRLEALKQSETFVLNSHQARAAQGLESSADAEMAQAMLLSIRQQLLMAKQQRVAFRESLRALTGGGELADIKSAPLPVAQTQLPSSLNYQLLARRPDLQAAHWYVQSSMKQIDAANAAFYPTFDIKAFFGFDALHLDDLFNHSSQQANIIPGLYLPIFSGGQLEANLDKSRHQRDILISQYNQAVLTAVKDVVTTGSALQSLQEEQLLQNEKVSSAAAGMNNAKARYHRGLISEAMAHEAQRQWLSEQIKQIEMQGQIVSQDIVLNKALGGGKI
ncbi:efflux transporter outer membrane subunit [Rahnella woolbedingensis]|uniref:Efflux transporter outer membrane subunit n=1 Tax=Rahnella woolbedingensis TaxID=1510574 RepID=A0A419N2K8_9GAMM|nr:efflux transporter outer membrane subunit [Rahnella woolbedingensis]RJT35114.1 efflux transporter outer membrane subunit [Rahnella woolbedingensis]